MSPKEQELRDKLVRNFNSAELARDAISSARFLAGRLLLTITTNGNVASVAAVAKSRSGLNGSFR